MRHNLAAFDVITGVPTAWDPGPISALALDGSTLYVAGGFAHIGGVARTRLAALDADSGVPKPWDPGTSGFIKALVPEGDHVYVGGDFTHVGGKERSDIAALDARTGLASDRDPEADDIVSALVPAGNVVYAGGLFDHIGGQARARVAALDRASGVATPWDADLRVGHEGTVPSAAALALQGDRLYVGGWFGAIGGVERENIAAVSTTTGLATDFDPRALGEYSPTVTGIAPGDGVVYAAGNFDHIGGRAQRRRRAGSGIRRRRPSGTPVWACTPASPASSSSATASSAADTSAASKVMESQASRFWIAELPARLARHIVKLTPRTSGSEEPARLRGADPTRRTGRRASTIMPRLSTGVIDARLPSRRFQARPPARRHMEGDRGEAP